MSAGAIHPTAVVAADASIGSGTTIGAHAVIESGVAIGADCEIQAHAVLCARTTIGRRNLVGYGAVLGGDPQAIGFERACESGLVVGDDNIIREHATLHRSTKAGQVTRVGSHNFLMAGAHVGHDCLLGDHVIMANNCLLGGHVSIGDRVFLGGGTVCHQFIRIGERAITQGISGFGKDLPPFLIGAGVNRVAGVNSVGLKRSGMPPAQRSQIRALHRLFFREGRSLGNALEEARSRDDWDPPARRFLEFIESTGSRGVCSAPRPGDEPA